LENLPSWLPKNIDADADGKMERMPIIMAQFPETNTAFNVNEMSRRVIQKAMQKGKK
jgi:poly(A) polymerase Pap1